MKRRVKEMEDEAAKIEAMQTQARLAAGPLAPRLAHFPRQVEQSLTPQQAAGGPAVDLRSIYVGNVRCACVVARMMVTRDAGRLLCDARRTPGILQILRHDQSRDDSL